MTPDRATSHSRDIPNRERLDELRYLGSALLDGDALLVLRRVAESVRAATDSIAVNVERIPGNTVIATACRDDPDDVDAHGEDVSRTVIALGRHSERTGRLVLLRRRSAAPVDEPTLERLGDLTIFASLAMHHDSLNTSLRETRERTNRVLEDRYRLLRGVGDELRERLGVAAEYVQLLDMEGELTEQERHYIDRSRRSIDAVIRIIRDVVQLSRIDTGNIPIRPEPANIALLVRGMARDVQLSVGTIGLKIDVAVRDGLPIIVTDIDWVRQVLDTLLSNAVRYSPVGGRVEVSADVRPGRRRSDPLRYVCVAVTDMGPGVGDHDRIFEEVYRVERPGEEPGFRLAIARRIAHLLGGELTLEPGHGRGSTFTLWLPDAAPGSVADHGDGEQTDGAALPGRGPPSAAPIASGLDQEADR